MNHSTISTTHTAVAGVAAGVPYLAYPPVDRDVDPNTAPLLLAWHMLDPPCTPVAMAAALPLHEVPAWRVYPCLPLCGDRAPAGGMAQVAQLAATDAVLHYYQPIFEQASAETPAMLDALRTQLHIADGPVWLVGGSGGGTVALLVLAETSVAVAAAAVVNPVARLADLISANERRYGVAYPWTEASSGVAARFDFVARVREITERRPAPSILLIDGAEDDPAIRQPLADLFGNLKRAHPQPDRIGRITISGMAHALAEPPGLEPAPQTAHAQQIDNTISEWINACLRHVGRTDR